MKDLVKEILKVSKENAPQARPSDTIRIDKQGNVTGSATTSKDTPVNKPDDCAC